MKKQNSLILLFKKYDFYGFSMKIMFFMNLLIFLLSYSFCIFLQKKFAPQLFVRCEYVSKKFENEKIKK